MIHRPGRMIWSLSFSRVFFSRPCFRHTVNLSCDYSTDALAYFQKKTNVRMSRLSPLLTTERHPRSSAMECCSVLWLSLSAFALHKPINTNFGMAHGKHSRLSEMRTTTLWLFTWQTPRGTTFSFPGSTISIGDGKAVSITLNHLFP